MLRQGTFVSYKEVKMEGRDRIVEIDIAKGIGILLVIFGHILPKGNIFREFIYTFHMPLFFFLSGVVMNVDSKYNLRDLVKKEIKLIISYYFYSLIFFVYDFVIRFILMEKVGVVFLLKNIYQTIVLYGIDVLWFLSSLLIGKILTRYLIMKIGKNYKLFFIALLFMTIPAFLWNPDWKIENENLVSYFIYFPINTIFRTIVVTGFIIMGILFVAQVRQIISSKVTYFLPGFLIINLMYVVLNGTNIDYHSMIIGRRGIFIIIAFTGVLGILGVSSILKRNKVIKNMLVYCSNASLFLMVTHNYFQVITFSDYCVHFINYQLNEHVIILIKCVIVLLIEILLCLTIKPIFDKYIEFIINFLKNKKVIEGSGFSG